MVKYGCFYLYGTPRGSPGDSQKNDGPVPDPYRNAVVPYRSRTVRDSYGIPRDPLQTPLLSDLKNKVLTFCTFSKAKKKQEFQFFAKFKKLEKQGFHYLQTSKR